MIKLLKFVFGKFLVTLDYGIRCGQVLLCIRKTPYKRHTVRRTAAQKSAAAAYAYYHNKGKWQRKCYEY